MECARWLEPNRPSPQGQPGSDVAFSKDFVTKSMRPTKFIAWNREAGWSNPPMTCAKRAGSGILVRPKHPLPVLEGETGHVEAKASGSCSGFTCRWTLEALNDGRQMPWWCPLTKEKDASGVERSRV